MYITRPMRYHYTPFRITKIKNRDTSNVGDDGRKPDHSYMAGGTIKWYSHNLENSLQFLVKLNM